MSLGEGTWQEAFCGLDPKAACHSGAAHGFLQGPVHSALDTLFPLEGRLGNCLKAKDSVMFIAYSPPVADQSHG